MHKMDSQLHHQVVFVDLIAETCIAIPPCWRTIESLNDGCAAEAGLHKSEEAGSGEMHFVCMLQGERERQAVYLT